MRLTIEYDGTDYHGWQIQPGLRTIQGTIQNKLCIITKSPIRLIGAGRTDSGVHAMGQVANFKTDSRMLPEEFKRALNSTLPRDIIIRQVEAVSDDFNARYSAKKRIYKYTILNESTSSPFLRNYTYLVPQAIDMGKMNIACQELLGSHDFSSFASTGDPVQNFVRTVTGAKVYRHEYAANDERFAMKEFSAGRDLIHFEIEANAFLRCMVRAIAGTLLDIGKGKIPPARMADIIAAKDRASAGPSLPARGLCLMRVVYQ